MKALTVQQPWATAIVRWGKTPENRSRNIAGAYRGELAIHAGKTEDEDGYCDEMIRQSLATYDDGWLLEEHLQPRGAIIGVANLWAVHPARPGCCPNQGAPPFGSPWAQASQWHLCLSDPRPLAEPIPCRGALGLWTPPAEALAQIEASAAATAHEPHDQGDHATDHRQPDQHEQEFSGTDAADSQRVHIEDRTR